MEYWKFF